MGVLIAIVAFTALTVTGAAALITNQVVWNL